MNIGIDAESTVSRNPVSFFLAVALCDAYVSGDWRVPFVVDSL